MNDYQIAQREVALKAIILAAGESALQHFESRPAGSFTLKGKQDFLTEADGLVEQQIRQAITEQFSNDQLLGEERGTSTTHSDFLWVIDPIDGTANFARGIAHFCISIAVVFNGVTELGAIYNPVSQELYLARRGGYAHKNGQLLQAASTERLDCASFELGWSNRLPRTRYLQVMESMLEAGANVRRSASGALALAWVAEGRSDGYIELHMHAWDCLAGLLLVREAGGVTGTYPQNTNAIFEGGPVLAAAPKLARTLSQISAIQLMNEPLTLSEKPVKAGYPRPAISLIESDLPGWDLDIYIGGSTGATDLALLAQHQIKTVINCAVNLDIDWVSESGKDSAPHLLRHGSGAVRYYKLGLIDGPGNTPEILYAGYQLMRSALLSQMPDKPSYRNRDRGNVLVNCRGGRSRSVILVALFLHLECPARYPTLDAAIARVRQQRQLHPDEWFETPKPELIQLAQNAITMHRTLQRSALKAIPVDELPPRSHGGSF
ncbi:inositol monophosphatase family protein [Celerinatantimonas sp. YJH-8]|uniref:inositol monophosphatase family protein n=1 Tax=Celerinatantimonas sp. YJH-8 TaxID=3228714 RepID=UPI0038BF2C3E